jgi:phage FluMu protein gp41
VDVDCAVGAAVAALRCVLHDAGTALVAVESVAGSEALERGLRREGKVSIRFSIRHKWCSTVPFSALLIVKISVPNLL